MTAQGQLPINAVKWLLECEARLGQIESSVQMLGKLVSKNTERMTSLLAQMEEMQCHLKSYLEAETEQSSTSSTPLRVQSYSLSESERSDGSSVMVLTEKLVGTKPSSD